MEGKSPSKLSSFNPVATRTPQARTLTSSFDATKSTPSSFRHFDSGSSSSPSVKKLSIKTSSSQKKSVPKSDFASQALATFVRSVRAITSSPPEATPESLQTLYSLCEGYVGQSSAGDASSQLLYDKIRLEIERSVSDRKRSLTRSAPTFTPADTVYATTANEARYTSAEGWLKEVDQIWKTVTSQLGMIRSIFLPLDRKYVMNEKSLLSIWDLGYDIFQNLVISDDRLSSQITACILVCINYERQGQAASRSTLSSVLQMLFTLSSSAHTNLFTTPFLANTREWYKSESNAFLDNLEGDKNKSTYLRHCSKRLIEEGERCDLTLDSSSSVSAASTGSGLKAALLRVVEKELIANHVDIILLGLPAFVSFYPTAALRSAGTSSEDSDLMRLYFLLSRVGQLPSLRKTWHAYVEEYGYKLVSDPSKDDTMVDSLLSFKRQVDNIVAGPFNKDHDLYNTSRDAFEVFINKRTDKPAEMLAKYLDIKMRAGNKAMSDAELESVFDQVLALFRFTSAKDLFEAFYTRLFAKRLLLNKSASSDMEKVMLVKLKEECGGAFTSKLETMAKDIDLSGDLMTSYKQHVSNANIHDCCELAVNVLTTGNWPSFSSSPCLIPQDMLRCLEHFKLFYSSKHTGRTLSWQHSLDQCTLRAAFPHGKKELNVSLFQAVILMLFNNQELDTKLSFKDIIALTQLDKKEAIRTLQSLACGKVRVLTKHPKGREVEESDEFSVNEAFKDEHFRIKINQIQIKETTEESKDTTERVFIDRQNHIQLVIVRTLKSRKTMRHSELIMEVVKQLKDRFKVETGEIKKAIASLIERDYMERGETKDVYNYLA